MGTRDVSLYAENCALRGGKMFDYKKLFFVMQILFPLSCVAMDRAIDIECLRGFFAYARASKFKDADEYLRRATSEEIQRGCDTTGKQPYTYDTALHVAIRLKNPAWIDLLITHQFLLNKANNVGEIPLDIALALNDKFLAERLIIAGSRPTRITLTKALEFSESMWLEFILKYVDHFNQDLTDLVSTGRQWLLLESARLASVQGIKYALEKYGTDLINAQEKTYKSTALHYAAQAGCTQGVTLLLTYGANSLIKDSYSETPLAVVQRVVMYAPPRDPAGTSNAEYYRSILEQLAQATQQDASHNISIPLTGSNSSDVSLESINAFSSFFSRKFGIVCMVGAVTVCGLYYFWHMKEEEPGGNEEKDEIVCEIPIDELDSQ